MNETPFEPWNLEENAVMSTIYALFFPETRATLMDLWAEKPVGLYQQAYDKRHDTMHEKFLDLWKSWSGITLTDQFPWCYYCNGASEPIAHIILQKRGFYPQCQLHVFEGEYQGYEAIAKAAGTKTVTHKKSIRKILETRFLPGDFFFISHPSGIDGEYWQDLEIFLSFMEMFHSHIEIFIDVTYQGLTQHSQAFSAVDHDNVSTVIFSLSKPFGVYPHRIGGIFSRHEIPSLFGNKWFKNYFSIELGMRLMRKFPRAYLPKKYAHVQKEAVAFAKATGQIPESAKASNVLLLATSPDGKKEFERAPGLYRYCLTPYIDQIVNWGKSPVISLKLKGEK